MENDAQLLSVTVEGMKFTFEASKEALELMLKLLMALKSTAIKSGSLGLTTGKKMFELSSFLRFRKNQGKTNQANFQLKSDGGGVNYAVDAKSYKLFQKYAPKAGLLYYEMAKLKEDGKVHILVPKERVSNLKAVMELVYEAEKGKADKQESKNDKKNEEDILQEPHAVQEESVEQYLKSQGMDSMGLEEVANRCREGMNEQQRQEFDAFIGELGELLGEQKQEETKQHIQEIKKAVQQNTDLYVLNRTDMVYVEIEKQQLRSDPENPSNLQIGKDAEEGTFSLPKENFLELENGNVLFVAQKDTVYPSKDKLYSAEDIKAALQKKNPSGQFVYSEEFQKLFRTGPKKNEQGNLKKEPAQWEHKSGAALSKKAPKR